MSQIVEAIDAELEEWRERLGEQEEAVRKSELRIEELGKLREQAIALNGGPPAPEPKPSSPSAKQRAPKRTTKRTSEAAKSATGRGTPTDEEREERARKVTARQAEVLELARRSEGVRPAEVAEALGIGVAGAADLLKRMSRSPSGPALLRREELVPGNPRKGVVYFARTSPITKPSDEGARTKVEQRVLDAVTEKQPIDETTLAFAAQLSTNDVRTVAAGLVRRGVLAKRTEDGTVLYEVAS